MTLTNPSSKKIYRWHISIGKDVKYHTLLGKWKLNNTETLLHTNYYYYYYYYYLIIIRIIQIWHSDNTKCLWRCRATGTLIHCWWECRLVHLLWKTVRHFLQNQISSYHAIQQFHSLTFTQWSWKFVFTQNSEHRWW